VVFDDSPAYEAGSARTSPEAHWVCGGRREIANPATARLTGLRARALAQAPPGAARAES
jgi:hypothetical protein